MLYLSASFTLTSLTMRANGAVSDPEDSSEVTMVLEDARLAACKSRRENGKLL